MDNSPVSESCSDEWTECSSRSELFSDPEYEELVIDLDERENVDVNMTLGALQNRAQNLHQVMGDLKQELDEEMTLLKQDLEEYRNVLNLKFHEIAAAAKAASEAYAAEKKIANAVSMTYTSSGQTFRPFAQEQKKFLADNDDDRFCSDKFGNLQDCTNCLKPLKQMVPRSLSFDDDKDINYRHYHHGIVCNAFEIAGN